MSRCNHRAKHALIRWSLLAVYCSALALGCAGQSLETQEIIDNLMQAGFPVDDIQVVGDVV